VADVADIFADPIRMESLVGSIERMSIAVDRLGDTAISAAKRLGVETREVAKEAEKLDDHFSDMEKNWFEVEKEVEKVKRSWLDMYGRLDDALDEHHRKWQRMTREMQRQMSQARGGLGAAGGEMGLGLSGGRGVMGAFKGVQSKILMGLPMGGLLGVMLYGAAREEGFRATTAQIMRTMDRIGGHTQRQVDEVRSDVEAMFSSWLGNGEEVMATMTALSEFNIGAERFEKVRLSMDGVGVSAQRLMSALDMVAKLPLGTTAKAIGTALESTGLPVTELTKQFMALRDVSKTTGTNFNSLMAMMMQGTSSLRLQRQGVGDLADAYMNLQAGLSTGAMRGMDPAAIKMAAMKGVGAIAQGIGGMSEGLMGYVSQRIQRRTGRGPGDAFESMMALRLGEMTGPGGEFLGPIVQELQSVARESIGGSRLRQIGGLTKLGFTDEAARAIIDMGKGASLEDVVHAMKDPQNLLLEAFQKRGSEANKWEQQMQKIMFDIAKIGVGMLTVLVAGFKSVGAAIVHSAAGDFDKASAVLMRGAAAQSKGFGTMERGFEALGGRGEEFMGMLNMANFETGLEGRKKAPARKGPSVMSKASDITQKLIKDMPNIEREELPRLYEAAEEAVEMEGGFGGGMLGVSMTPTDVRAKRIYERKRKKRLELVNEAGEDTEVIIRKKRGPMSSQRIAERTEKVSR
jgi:hypothetical protein